MADTGCSAGLPGSFAAIVLETPLGLAPRELSKAWPAKKLAPKTRRAERAGMNFLGLESLILSGPDVGVPSGTSHHTKA